MEKVPLAAVDMVRFRFLSLSASSVPLGGRLHLCAAAGLSLAAVGTATLSHHTFSPLPPVFPLSPSSSLPASMCLVSCVWHWCHYWAARITLFPDKPSVCFLSVSRAPLPPHPSFNPQLHSCRWLLCVTFLPKTCCPSQILPTMPCTACYLIPIPRSLSPSPTRMT